MELDELKKSWNELNKHLEKEELFDKQALENLITQFKQKTDNKINKIAGWEKFSIIIGGIAVLLIIIASFFIIPLFGLENEMLERVYVVGFFFSIILIIGFWWDAKTYHWIHNIKIDELSVVTVVERINRFHIWMKYEVIAIGILLIPLIGLLYYFFDMSQKSLTVQAIFLVFCIVCSGLLIYYLYKKLIFDSLKEIKKNLDELQDLKDK